uniref:Signal recognition particle receptor subunit alpha n=1 Tax=Lygus hesperus TaxID=30085 RepID=A0A0A9ZB02_LYGHE
MGYGTDPSTVAATALAQAAREHIDVVMIDTAGRMQDHESRMRALAKLIHDNSPDLVLFVGEALVGNNGIDQLRKFNRCLIDYAPVGSQCHGIDGIVLTKFDTVDDKVGAALTMAYELGQPIVFVGVGQTYQDLKIMDHNIVVNALMA